MEQVFVYGKEHTFLDPDTGLLFRNSSIHQTAKLHTHTFYEIFLVTDGTALHMINQTIRTLHRGDLVFIRPQDTHTYEFHCSEDFRIVNVGFSRQIFQSIVLFLNNYQELQELTHSELPSVISLQGTDLEKVKSTFLTIGESMKILPATQTIFSAKVSLTQTFVEYFLHYTENVAEENHIPEWFTNLMEEMQKIENLQLGFKRMQELAPCSVNHLCRLCKKYLSVTPTQYINERRLEYAVYLLCQTSYDILSISSLCGFNNLSHFYHLFKEQYQTSPSNFRKTGS